VQYIRQVSSALSAVHQAELVHGRVAPSTIVCPAHSEIAVLTNPSLLPGVSSRDADLDCDPYAAIGLTQARSLTPAADGYALAATLYFVVTGQPPLSARLRQTQPLVPPRQLQPDLSQAVESAILAGMELALANRPGTVADWLALLPSDLPDSAVGKGTSALPISTAATVLETALESEVGTTGKAPRSSFSQANGGTIATSSDRKDSAFSTKVQPSLPTQGEEPVPNGRVATEPVQPQPATLPAVRKPKSKPASRSNAATNQRFSRMVMTGATIAAIAGLGFGLTLRLVLNRNPALSPFNLDQTFPTLKNSNQPPSIPWPEPVFDQEPTQPD
jgi:serine/threonine-protein kinase